MDAGGLQVVAENQAVYFLHPLTGEILATMDPLYVYDSFDGEKTEENPHDTYNNELLCTQLEDGTYEITMVVDEAFLNDPSTVYPVVVDPSGYGDKTPHWPDTTGSTLINKVFPKWICARFERP